MSYIIVMLDFEMSRIKVFTYECEILFTGHYISIDFKMKRFNF